MVGKSPRNPLFTALFSTFPASNFFPSRFCPGNYGDEIRRSSVWVGILLFILHTGRHFRAGNDRRWLEKIHELRPSLLVGWVSSWLLSSDCNGVLRKSSLWVSRPLFRLHITPHLGAVNCRHWSEKTIEIRLSPLCFPALVFYLLLLTISWQNSGGD